jgi:hypothetical protein
VVVSLMLSDLFSFTSSFIPREIFSLFLHKLRSPRPLNPRATDILNYQTIESSMDRKGETFLRFCARGWRGGGEESKNFFFPFRFHIIVESFMTKHERALRILLRAAGR